MSMPRARFSRRWWPPSSIHPHRNLEDFARIVAGYLGNTANDRLLWLLGWSFGYGLSQLLTMCEVGGQLIVPASVLAADVVTAHADHGATAIAQVPFGWDQLVSFLERTGRQLAGLRYVTNAGDRPSAALIERMRRVLPGAQIALMYGQTECFRTAYLPAAQLDAKLGAMGYPIPEVEVRVVAPDGTPCAPGVTASFTMPARSSRRATGTTPWPRRRSSIATVSGACCAPAIWCGAMTMAACGTSAAPS